MPSTSQVEASKMPNNNRFYVRERAEASQMPKGIMRIESKVIGNGTSRGGRIITAKEDLLSRLRKSDNKRARSRKRIERRQAERALKRL